MLKKLVYSAPILAAASAFAETGAPTSTVNWTDQANTAKSELATVVSALVPMVAAVVAMVAGARLLAKLVNRAVGK